MKGLRKVLTPFAPDQSGAVSVLYALGGMVVILDAGGCTGNICGFDEPRWQTQKSAVFSAGLRDMDAIFGRDDALVEKIAFATKQMDAAFIALVGTPVPAVIGTDFAGLKRMVAKKTGLPVLAPATDGMAGYDRGIEKTWLELVKTCCTESAGKARGGVGVLGASPMDFSETVIRHLPEICSLDAVAALSRTEKNIVVSPAGLKAAKYCQNHFGTPYRCGVPAAFLPQPFNPADYDGARVLIVHQQFVANTIREQIASQAKRVMVASWFMMDRQAKAPGDVQLKEEDDFAALLAGGAFDAVVADAALKPLVPDGCDLQWIDCPHFALSGRKMNG